MQQHISRINKTLLKKKRERGIGLPYIKTHWKEVIRRILLLEKELTCRQETEIWGPVK